MQSPEYSRSERSIHRESYKEVVIIVDWLTFDIEGAQ